MSDIDKLHYYKKSMTCCDPSGKNMPDLSVSVRILLGINFRELFLK